MWEYNLLANIRLAYFILGKMIFNVIIFIGHGADVNNLIWLAWPVDIGLLLLWIGGVMFYNITREFESQWVLVHKAMCYI